MCPSRMLGRSLAARSPPAMQWSAPSRTCRHPPLTCLCCHRSSASPHLQKTAHVQLPLTVSAARRQPPAPTTQCKGPPRLRSSKCHSGAGRPACLPTLQASCLHAPHNNGSGVIHPCLLAGDRHGLKLACWPKPRLAGWTQAQASSSLSNLIEKVAPGSMLPPRYEPRFFLVFSWRKSLRGAGFRGLRVWGDGS